MFSYQIVQVRDLSLYTPRTQIKDVLVYGDSYVEDYQKQVFFKIEKQSLFYPNQKPINNNFLRGVMPLRYLNDMYLYLTTIEGEIVFIEPKYFERWGENQINRLMQKKNIKKDLECMPVNPVRDYFLSAPLFYELTDSSRTEKGHQYLTDAYLSKYEDQWLDLKEYDYVTHYEPLTFPLGGMEFILVTKEDLVSKDLRLLESDYQGKVLEIARIPIKEVLSYMKKETYHVFEIRKMKQILKKLEEIIHEKE